MAPRSSVCVEDIKDTLWTEIKTDESIKHTLILHFLC
jgi:hypothetical protein